MNKTFRIAMIALLAIIIVGILLAYLKKDSISVKHNQQGLEHYEAEKYDLAIESFEKAIKWNKNWLSPKINIAQVLYITKAFDKIPAALDAITSTTDSIATPEILKGLIALKSKDYNSSITHFSSALLKDSLNYRPYYYRGICYANMDNFDAAIADYKKSKALKERMAEIAVDSTIIIIPLEDYSASVGSYSEDVSGVSNFADAFYNRGYFKLNIDDLEGALTDLNRVIEIDDRYPNAYYYRGLAYAKNKQIDLAISDFTKSIEQKHKKYNSLYNIGFAYFNLKEYSKAKTTISKMVNEFPNGEKNAASYKLLGTIDLIQSKHSSAITNFNKAIALNNNSADTYFNRAICYGYIKEHEKAIEDLIKCYALGMRTGDVHFARGVQYASLSKFREACYDFREAEKMKHPKAKEMISTYCQNN